MPVRFREPDGSVWEFDTPQEADEFRAARAKRETKAPNDPSQVRPPTARTPTGRKPKISRWATITVGGIQKALAALAEAGDQGMLGEGLASVLGLRGPKGLAGGASSIRKYLVQVLPPGVSPDKVFWKVDGKKGAPRRWYVNPKYIKDYEVLDVA